MALKGATPEAAGLVACECVVIAETKDHLNWELIGKQGWCRELWIQSLGMKAVLPPPEERKHVKTAIGASRAQQASERSGSWSLLCRCPPNRG